MKIERVLLLFDDERPCWDARCVALAGEDPGALRALLREGLVEREEEIFFLSPAGKERFSTEARECFCAVVPGERPRDVRRAVRRNRMALTLDAGFLARWGLKNLRQGARLPFVPALDRGDVWTFDGGEFSWTYGMNSLVREMFEKWPPATAPEAMPRELALFEAWRKARGISWGELEVDVLILQQYDFEDYMRFAPRPDDRLGFLNTDRLYCFLADPTENSFVATCCDRIGAMHLFLNAQRRLFLPWYFDHDMEEQDAVNWVFFVTETEEASQRAQRALLPFGEHLVDGVMPLDIWTLSLEALEGRKRHEMFWDLFAETAHAVARTP